MRFVLLCIFLLWLTGSGMAQRLSYNTLLKYRKLEESMELHEKLSRKGWVLLSDTPPTDSLTGIAFWGYKPVDGKAVAWLTQYYFYDQNSIIRYHTDCNCTLDAFKKKMREWRMYKGEQGQHSKYFQEPYQFTEYIGKNYVIRLLQFPEQPFAVEVYRKNYYDHIKHELW